MSYFKRSRYSANVIGAQTLTPGAIQNTHCKYNPVSLACNTYTCKSFSSSGFRTSGNVPYNEISMANSHKRCPIGYYITDSNECMYLGLDSLKALNNSSQGTPSQVLLDVAAYGPNASYGQYHATEDELRAAAYVLKEAESCNKISFP